ncbi:hypothetical protein, variant 1 [Aphanomyces astaci]|uniref:Uncharacterized protein n=1 Tax=Aphanomyces astaci TaxID=112090 RepID=W4FMH2_APHAT|nr:hypothetical protein, variant 1 [Aphanomyces astaci]ETV67898.1 hypothetical protein, variant 1 [Aphanomyces astaci]|eukprot:XP_009842644.1 hypothetical protein, variant 1 [Aphanomyces astaci]
MITSEKRFGHKFSTGREEEPGPSAYTLLTDFDAAARQRFRAAANGFGAAPRSIPPPKLSDVGMYNPEVPGAFPNVYTVEQWENQQKQLQQETRVFRTSSPPPRIHVSAGPGSYHTELDMSKEGHDGYFSKAKRPDLTGYMESLGQVGDSPGPKYLPDSHSIAAKCRRGGSPMYFPRHNSSPGALDQSFLELDQSFRKLTHALASPALWKPSSRSPMSSDRQQSGPGSYNKGTDFVKRSTKKGTFGTAKQLDMLATLVASGRASQSPVGPGQYDVQWDVFGGKTYNTRAGYVPKQAMQTALDPVPVKTTVAPSRMFESTDALPPREIWRAMRRTPDPKKLGYDNGVPSLTQKKHTSNRRALVQEAKYETSGGLPPDSITLFNGDGGEDEPHERKDEEAVMQLELPPESGDISSFEL